jgi:hypothetical protein
MADINYEEELRNLEAEQAVDYEEELRQLSLDSDRTATTEDLISMRRGEQTTETKTEQPVDYEQELRQLNETPVATTSDVPTAGFMPIDPTSEFAGMDMEPEKSAPSTYTFDDLWQRDDLFNIIQDYAKARSGREFKGDITNLESDRTATTEDLIRMRRGEKTTETRQEFVADWMESMRGKELNVLMEALPELNYIRNASPEDAAKTALVHKVYQETAGVTEKGGQAGFRPYADAVKAIVTDPLNYLGFIFGKGAGVAVSKATSEAIKKATTIGTSVATEALVGGGGDIVDQRIQQAVSEAAGEEVDELNPWRVGAAMILSGATAGYAGGKAATRTKPKEGFLKEELKKRAEEVIPQSPTSPVTSLEKKLIDPVNKQIDEEVSNFVKKEGAKILDQFGPASAMVDAKIATELSGRAVRVALRVIQDDPEFMIKPSQKTSDAIERVFASLDTIDDAVLERAIRAEGLTPADFAAANKVTVSDAARIMQQYSNASQLMKRLRGADPEFDKQMKDLYDEKSTGAWEIFRAGLNGIYRVEREGKAWITSGVDTTMRNVAGTAIGLTAKSGSDIMEGLLYSLGVAVKDGVQGKGFKRAADSLAGSLQDATRTFVYMKKNGLAGEVTDVLLEHSPVLRNNLLSALQETSNRDISRIGKMANVLNTAQDVFFRRAIFTASVETSMRRQGMDMYKMIQEGKLIPTAVLSRAVDDALKASFSYMPKPGKKGIEGAFEAGSGRLIRFIEQIPFSSLAIPFPRFMANAMAFQYRYSPIGGLVGGGSDYVKYIIAKNAGETDKATKALRDGNLKVMQGSVGLGGLMAAYDYRMNNLDTEWYNIKNDDGSTTDIRALFPLAPYFAVADLFARAKQGVPYKISDAYQAVVGMKMPAGSQNVIADQLIASIDTEKEAEQWAITVGKMFGDFATRFTQPFVVKNFYDLYDLINEEGAVARDPNVIDTDATVRVKDVPIVGPAVNALGFEGDLPLINTDAVKKRIQSRIPGWKEDLPEAIPRLREGPIIREGQFFNRLVGFRKDPYKNPIEREVAKLNFEAWSLYGSPSGDKEYDRLYTEEANKQVMRNVGNTLKSPTYQALSPLKKRLALKSSINRSTDIAKKIVNGTYKAADIEKVYKNKYNKFSQEKRMLINEMYADDHDGVTLEKAKDYMAIDVYEKKMKAIEMAAGGFVGKAALKGLVKSSGKKTSADLMEEMQKKAAVKATPPVAPEIEASLAKQTEEAIPPSTIQVSGLSKYAPEEVAAAEAKASEFEGASSMEFLKKNHPEKYDNTVFIHMGKDADDEPHLGAGSIFDFIDDEGAYDFTKTVAQKEAEAPPTTKGLMQPVDEEPVVMVSDRAIKGPLKTISNLDDRNDMIEQIREVRTQRFPKLKVEGVEDSVIGIAQGDFRLLNKREADPSKAKDRLLFKDLAQKKQKELDRLRVKYKDTPPIELFHGNPNRAEGLAKSGFAKPQREKFKQTELEVAAPSFTKDLNLQFNTGSFGGRDPSAIVSTKMPYADYLFSRVNMPREAYNNQDLDVIAQSISGDPLSTRPLSLPRTGNMNETEDAFVEADKLMINKADESVASKLADYEPIAEKRSAAIQMYNSYAAVANDTKKFQALPEKEQRIAANNSYKAVRELFKSYAAAAKITSTKTGMGQQYTARVAASPLYPTPLRNIADVLEKQGSVERAKLLRKIADNMDDIRKSDNKVPATRAIQEAASKLAKGGLASRK